MSQLIAQCPSCQSAHLNVVKIECRRCSTRFEGSFEIPILLRLAPDDLRFVIQFVKSSGSLKDMASQYGVSYPTLRNRLNELIDRLHQLEERTVSEKEAVLQLLEEGKISAKEAALRLNNL